MKLLLGVLLRAFQKPTATTRKFFWSAWVVWEVKVAHVHVEVGPYKDWNTPVVWPEICLHLSNNSWKAESLQISLLVGFSPERDNEVNELLADPGPVPQWGVIVHPLPRDGDEGGMHIFITHLHCNRNCSFSPRPMLCQSQKRKFWQLSS